MSSLSRKSAEVFARMLPENEREDYLAAVAPVKDGARVAGGHAAQAFDAAFMVWLREEHQRARDADLARLRHVGPPHVRTGPGGDVITIVGKGPADFQGAIRGETGRPWRLLAVEAKSREGRLQRHEIAPHQRDDLAWVESVGGVALVVIELHTGEGLSFGTWALPWSELERRWKRSARKRSAAIDASATVASASVGPEELRGWEVLDARGYLARFVEVPHVRA